MHEYAAFSPSHANPEMLADELTRRATDGWEVVSVVTTQDGRLCAFLRRPSRTTATTGVTAAGAVATATASSTTSNPPPDWYADPSGRFELRYWNGREWTEHVARGGRQSVDPPRA